MKHKNINWLSLITLAVLALGLMAFAPLPPPALPPLQTPNGDKIVMGDNYTLESGDTLNGGLYVFGGNAELKEDSTVTGDVVVLGGILKANGKIEGDINIIGGLATLGESAVIEGDVNALSANLLQDQGAVVKGEVNSNLRFPSFIPAPSTMPIPILPGSVPVRPQAPSALDMGIGLIGKFLWWLGRSFIWAFLALLAVMFWPRHAQRVAEVAVANPAPSGGLGLLTAVIMPLVLGLIALTICGIPITIIGLLALAAAWAFGLIALGLETGARLEQMIRVDWAPPVQAAIGTFVLTLVTNGVGWIVPCVGWLVPFGIGCIGLGAVLLTRFGSRPYPPVSTAILDVPPASQPPAGMPVTQVVDLPVEGGAHVYGPESDDLPPAL